MSSFGGRPDASLNAEERKNIQLLRNLHDRLRDRGSDLGNDSDGRLPGINALGWAIDVLEQREVERQLVRMDKRIRELESRVGRHEHEIRELYEDEHEDA